MKNNTLCVYESFLQKYYLMFIVYVGVALSRNNLVGKMTHKYQACPN